MPSLYKKKTALSNAGQFFIWRSMLKLIILYLSIAFDTKDLYYSTVSKIYISCSAPDANNISIWRSTRFSFRPN